MSTYRQFLLFNCPALPLSEIWKSYFHELAAFSKDKLVKAIGKSRSDCSISEHLYFKRIKCMADLEPGDVFFMDESNARLHIALARPTANGNSVEIAILPTTPSTLALFDGDLFDNQHVEILADASIQDHICVTCDGINVIVYRDGLPIEVKLIKDMQSMHGTDSEAVLISLMAGEIKNEMASF